jgi:ribonuclease HI
MAMLPAEHPLHKVITNKNTRNIKRHKSPLNDLTARYSFDFKRVEKIPTTTSNPSKRGKLPFKVRIAENREDSTKEAENAPEEIQVFSDGSAINGKVGAAAILIRAGNPPRTLHFHLGPEKEHTVHEAELVGVLLGLQLIKTEKHRSTTFMLGVDNQAAIKAFQSELRSPGHHLAREIVQIANQVKKRRNKKRYALTICWTAGHEGITGNEAADEEAKKAAEGKTSDKRTLPPYLRKPLLINPAAIKRSFHEELKKEWTNKWRNSIRGQRAIKLDKTTPSKKFLGAISNNELSREMASRITQFKISHAPINHFLKRIGKVDSARCPACGADEETIEHYLLTCPSYAHERWALTQQTKKKRKQLTIETLLGEQDLTIPLTNYIEATHRFDKQR